MEKQHLTALEILRQLDKTNCRECGANTCLAFASLVIQNKKRIADCPYLDKSVAANLSSRLTTVMLPGQDPALALLEVKKRIHDLDFNETSRRLGLALVGDRLRVHVLGRIFDIDQNGDLHTMCHVNHWIHGPLLNFILNGEGQEPVGEWVPYTMFSDVEETAPFFTYFCEKALQRLADEHTDLVISILETFGKRIVCGLADADVSVILMPLPNVPFLYSYWRSERDFPSKLAIHFDRTATVNLDVRSILFLATGLTEMFSRFVNTHAG